MSDVSAPTHGFCSSCLIAYEEGAQKHETERDCIAHLKLALRKSRERERNTAFAVANRMLGILEELIHRPEAGGVDFKVWTGGRMDSQGVVGGSIEERTIPPQQVSGIFAAILSMYEQMGDWSPYQAEKDRADEMQDAAVKLLHGVLQMDALVDELGDKDCDEFAVEVRRTLSSLPGGTLSLLRSYVDQQETPRH